jgi:two-component system sensor histidine kinase UhpB
VQESLTNVARHANATQVNVSLRCSVDGHVNLNIEDNGQGMLDPQANHAGFGLLGMRERSSSLGGQLKLTSKPGQGLQIQVQLKLEVS